MTHVEGVTGVTGGQPDPHALELGASCPAEAGMAPARVNAQNGDEYFSSTFH